LKYVLDACAVIALLNEEEGNAIVDDLFRQAAAGTITLYMSIINLVEVLYGYYQDEGPEKTTEILTKMNASPVKIIDVISPAIFHDAYRLKGSYSISLADAFAGATAKTLSATLVTKDSEFEPVEAQGEISVLWIK
jgi:predicted nucleic acid-binding protein